MHESKHEKSLSPCDFKYKDLNILEGKCANDGPVIADEFPCECLRDNRPGWWDVVFSCVTMQCYFHPSQKDGMNLSQTHLNIA